MMCVTAAGRSTRSVEGDGNGWGKFIFQVGIRLTDTDLETQKFEEAQGSLTITTQFSQQWPEGASKEEQEDPLKETLEQAIVEEMLKPPLVVSLSQEEEEDPEEEMLRQAIALSLSLEEQKDLEKDMLEQANALSFSLEEKE